MKGRLARLLLALVVVLGALPLSAESALAASCDTSGQQPTTTVYLPNVTKTLGGPAGWVTPFYIQNSGSIQTTIDVSFYRFSDGSFVVCRRTSGLAPGTSVLDDPNADTDLPGNTQFSVVVKSFGAPIVAMVNQLQGSGATTQALSYSGFTQGATTVYLPNVTRRFFGWDVPFIVQDLGTVPASVTARFMSFDGTKTYTKTFTVQPGRSVVVDPDYEPAFNGTPNSGLVDGTQYAVTLTATQPIAVVVNAHSETGSPVAFSHNGLFAGATTLYAPYAMRTASLFSPVVVQNLGTATVDATLTFTPTTPGTGPQTFTLAAIPGGGSRAFDVRYATGDTARPLCPATPLAGCLGIGEYALRITAPTPIAAVVLPNSATTAAAYVAATTLTQRAVVPVMLFDSAAAGVGWQTDVWVQMGTATNLYLSAFAIPSGDLLWARSVGPAVGAPVFTISSRTFVGVTYTGPFSLTIESLSGTFTAIAFERAGSGGDASMIFEAFPVGPPLSAFKSAASIRVTPESASVGPGETGQLTAVVKDQFGVVMAGAPVSWSVSPPTLGTISGAGLFTAGTAGGTGTVTATSGAVSATASLTVVPPTTVTVGGLSFVRRTTAASDLYLEAAVSATDRATIETQAAADVAQIQLDFGRTFAERPRIYVFATTPSYTQGLQSILGLSAASAANVGAGSTGVWVQNSTAHAVGIDWQKQRTSLPATALRHELAHWMQHQIVGANAIPAWFDEGNARHAEYAIPLGEYKRMQNRYGAASMAATGTLLTLADMTDPNVWNARPGRAGVFQYYAASEAVQLLRTDLGQPKIVQILERLGQGQTFDTAYAAVSGQSFATFSSTYATRVRAIAPVYPGIATAPDSTIGPGLSVQLYGFTPGSTVTVSVSSSQPFTQPVDEFGTYVFYLGASFPPGRYTITATSSTGQTATTVGVKLSSVFDASVLDAGETGPRIIEELPLPTRD